MQKNGYTFTTVYSSKCVTVFLNQTLEKKHKTLITWKSINFRSGSNRSRALKRKSSCSLSVMSSMSSWVTVPAGLDLKIIKIIKILIKNSSIIVCFLTSVDNQKPNAKNQFHWSLTLRVAFCKRNPARQPFIFSNCNY